MKSAAKTDRSSALHANADRGTDQPPTRAGRASLTTTLMLIASATPQAQWSVSQLSEARSELAATHAGGVALFAGGRTIGGSKSDVVDLYDVSTGTWSVAALSQARSGLAATSAGDIAIFAGGIDASGSRSAMVDLYDATTGTWSTASLSEAREAPASASWGDVVAFFGGNVSFAQGTTTVDIYDAATDTWSTANLSTPRYVTAAATIGDRALVVSGVDHGFSPYLTSVEFFDFSTGTVSQAESTVFGRGDHEAAAVGGLGVFAGGTSPTSPVDLVEVYDEATDTWSPWNLSQARRSLANTVVDGVVMFAGGDTVGGAGDDPSAVVDLFNTVSGTWSTNSLSTPRSDLAATSVGSVALFAGGWDGAAPSAVVDIYDGDCNGNGIPDSLDLASATSFDCNLNGVPDECDVTEGSSHDLDGNGVPDECLSPPLGASPLEVSLAAGGVQAFALEAGVVPVANLYLLLGTQGGTDPGLPVDGLTLPLNWDTYLEFTLANANQGPLWQTFGVLPPTGSGAASLTIPAGLDPGLAGSTLHHAFVVFDLTTTPGKPFVGNVSNPVPLALHP